MFRHDFSNSVITTHYSDKDWADYAQGKKDCREERGRMPGMPPAYTHGYDRELERKAKAEQRHAPLTVELPKSATHKKVVELYPGKALRKVRPNNDGPSAA